MFWWHNFEFNVHVIKKSVLLSNTLGKLIDKTCAYTLKQMQAKTLNCRVHCTDANGPKSPHIASINYE